MNKSLGLWIPCLVKKEGARREQRGSLKWPQGGDSLREWAPEGSLKSGLRVGPGRGLSKEVGPGWAPGEGSLRSGPREGLLP